MIIRSGRLRLHGPIVIAIAAIDGNEAWIRVFSCRCVLDHYVGARFRECPKIFRSDLHVKAAAD